ncbi:MAG: TetR/AcrR family transcriptional regulator [Caulobacter sp.]|nr:TetR/AcrR family transcriptional regulator [Caulobacter sp.]
MGDRGEGTRSARKRRDIMQAGQSVFLREGYSGAGMEVVAREASVSTATLYAHFPGKGDLFVAVVESAVRNLAHDIEETLDFPGAARERLLAFSHAYARFYTDPLSRAVFRLVIAERRRFTELADHFRNRSRHALGGNAITLIGQLVEEGLLKVEKPAWAAGQLLGMLEHATLVFGLVAGDDVLPRRPIDDICADAVDTFLARYGT